MGSVVVTLRILPESPEISLKSLENKISKKIIKFAGKGEIRFDEEPIGFGLSALNVIFVYDENKGDTEKLEGSIKRVKGIRNVEVSDVRRAIG